MGLRRRRGVTVMGRWGWLEAVGVGRGERTTCMDGGWHVTL